MATSPLISDPLWWESAPLRDPPAQRLQKTCDVAVVGAGYSGLSAALTLARAGRSVQIFDKQRAGEGASTRNGGICSGNIRPGFDALRRAFGDARASAILLEGKAAREDLRAFIEDEGLSCDYAMTGRFAGAMTLRDYDGLAREADFLRDRLGVEAYAVPRREQSRYLGTELYNGGAVRMDVGALHPGKLHAEMMRLALAAGVALHARTAVTGVETDGAGHRVRTARGDLLARDVIVTTNAYADSSDRWLRRRIVPVRSRIIATERLPREVFARLMPAGMMCSDTRKLSYYYRPAPDEPRILFGGRDGTYVGEADWPTEHLRRELARLFPELSDVAITHSWYGYVGMNRDMIPRIFSHRGRRYATGYCGSGVVWARWHGKKAALSLLGDAGSTSAFDFRPPPAVPFFNGVPWFMPGVFAWFGAQDRRALRAASVRSR